MGRYPLSGTAAVGQRGLASTVAVERHGLAGAAGDDDLRPEVGLARVARGTARPRTVDGAMTSIRLLRLALMVTLRMMMLMMMMKLVAESRDGCSRTVRTTALLPTGGQHTRQRQSSAAVIDVEVFLGRSHCRQAALVLRAASIDTS